MEEQIRYDYSPGMKEMTAWDYLQSQVASYASYRAAQLVIRANRFTFVQFI
jgi:hypothetical protein